jgi:YHS domain-containing protein
MLKFIIFAVAAFVLYKLITGDKRKKQQNQEREVHQKAAQGEMVKDPVCGAYVSKDSEIRVRSGDTVHCFCSYDCRDKYLKQLGHTPPVEKAEAEEKAKDSHEEEAG